MKLVLTYTLTFAALICVFFMDHSARTAYLPLKEGLLYSNSVSSQTTLNDEVTEKILFKRTAEDEYPTIEAASTENLPGKFLVRLIEPKDAKYRLVTAAALVGRPEGDGKGQVTFKRGPGGPKTARDRSAEQTKAAIAAVTVQKDVPQEVLNVNKVRDIVNNSEKTYFFPGIEKTLNEVTLTVKSVTPWQNKSVLTLELDNSVAKYFFVSNISITSAGTPLPIESFNDPFIPGKKRATFFVIARALKAEPVAVKLSESGGETRVFDLRVAVP